MTGTFVLSTLVLLTLFALLAYAYGWQGFPFPV